MAQEHALRDQVTALQAEVATARDGAAALKSRCESAEAAAEAAGRRAAAAAVEDQEKDSKGMHMCVCTYGVFWAVLVVRCACSCDQSAVLSVLLSSSLLLQALV